MFQKFHRFALDNARRLGTLLALGLNNQIKTSMDSLNVLRLPRVFFLRLLEPDIKLTFDDVADTPLWLNIEGAYRYSPSPAHFRHRFFGAFWRSKDVGETVIFTQVVSV